METKSIATRISIPMYDLIESLTKERGITLSDFLKEALNAHLNALNDNDLSLSELHYLTSALTYQMLHLGTEKYEANK